jgi:glycosyltransferase involved in cell wall biosynthesis
METAFLYDLCRYAHAELRPVPWIEMTGMSEERVAGVLQESAIYLSLCRFEAYPLSILEAFACGCVTAGFTGGGSRIYTNARNGFWAEEDDCIGCAEQLRRAVQLVTELGPRYYDVIEAARCVADQHSPPMLARRLVRFWQAFLEKGCFPSGP